MGWSCRQDAMETLEAWGNFCVNQMGSQNTYEYRGSKYFFDTSRKEHTDGAITGSVFKMTGELCRKCGSFRIEGNGTVTRAPAGLIQLMDEEMVLREQEHNYYRGLGV